MSIKFINLLVYEKLNVPIFITIQDHQWIRANLADRK
jgi:hypothetical protein